MIRFLKRAGQTFDSQMCEGLSFKRGLRATAYSPSDSFEALDGIKVLILAHDREAVLAGESGDPEIV